MTVDNGDGMGGTGLGAKLAARIGPSAPMTLHDFIDACLYDEDHGYYKRASAIGADGDFTTAPEISQIFGELIGLWAGETWRQMGSPSPVRLVELGPGRGTLMADALRALKVLPDFLAAASIHMVETSPVLRKHQQTAPHGLPSPISWASSVDDVPSGPAIVIANEFLDCLPVRQYVFDAASKGFRERMVECVDGRLYYAPLSRSPLAPLPDYFTDDALPAARNGDMLELRPGNAFLLEAFAARTPPFAAIFIDYGHERTGYGDTVQAVRRHQFAGLFDDPGTSDITAHVDFEALAKVARQLGLKPHGPMAMGQWLLKLGAEARLTRLQEKVSAAEALQLANGLRRLVDPAKMGLLFKVSALTNGVSATPIPF